MDQGCEPLFPSATLSKNMHGGRAGGELHGAKKAGQHGWRGTEIVGVPVKPGARWLLMDGHRCKVPFVPCHYGPQPDKGFLWIPFLKTADSRAVSRGGPHQDGARAAPNPCMRMDLNLNLPSPLHKHAHGGVVGFLRFPGGWELNDHANLLRAASFRITDPRRFCCVLSCGPPASH